MRVLPTKWRRKPAGIDMERNYVTVTLCMLRPTKFRNSAAFSANFRLRRQNTWLMLIWGGSVAEWLACWTHFIRRRRARVQIAVATLSCNSLGKTVHTHCASVHQVAKLVAALLRVAGVTAGLAESNGSLPPGL